jgi:hypothetical protein
MKTDKKTNYKKAVLNFIDTIPDTKDYDYNIVCTTNKSIHITFNDDQYLHGVVFKYSFKFFHDEFILNRKYSCFGA